MSPAWLDFTAQLPAPVSVTVLPETAQTSLELASLKLTGRPDEAVALEPIGGSYARILFGLGLMGASLLAAGVLPLATTYMLSEALGFERGVSRTWSEAPIFLGLFTGLVAVGAVLALFPGLPLIQVLVGVYVLNGLLLPIELFAILSLINNRELMGDHVNRGLYNVLAWAIAIIVSLLSLTLIAITVLGWFGVNLGA